MKMLKIRYLVGLLVIIVLTIIFVFRGEIFLSDREMITYSTDDLQPWLYKNPMGISNIGDPFVLKASDGNYYCYPTSWNMGFKAWVSKNLVEWEEIGAVYTPMDSWGNKDFWAPEVVEYKGRYYMYYTARWTKNGSLRIGVAVSDSPKGPFKDVYDHPMFDFGYAAIDANVLIDDDGNKYLYYSRDCSENIIEGRHESHIYGVRLKEDMVSVDGEPVLLTKPEQEWEKASGAEWRWNEGPTVFKRNGLYYMMYSANFYADKAYSIGYATSKKPLGPYVKYENNPIIAAEKGWDHVSGPGHNSITLSPDGSELFSVYHTHTVPVIGGGDRQVCIDRMGFRKDGSIYVNGPTISSQMLPSGSTGFRNISNEAKITVSSTKEGFVKEALIDGEFGIYEKYEGLDWVSEEEGKSEWIKLSWDKKRILSGVLLYKSTLSERIAEAYEIHLDTGEVIKNISFPEEPGSAAVISFPERNVRSIKIIMSKKSKSVGLSEVVVVGK